MSAPRRVVLLLAVAWAGCAGLPPAPSEVAVQRSAELRPGAGYVGGSLSIASGADPFTFGIVDAAGREYLIKFQQADPGSPAVSLVELPPGDYRVAFWTTTSEHDQRKYLALDEGPGRPFAVRAGTVVVLGRFAARREEYDGTTKGAFRIKQRMVRWSIEREPLPADDAWTLLTRAFPGFTGAPVECVACTAPVPGAAHAAAPPSPPAGEFTPAHELVIHLHRTDRAEFDYGSPALIAWESFDREVRRRDVVGASRRSPMPWRDWDDFGARWVLNDVNFRNGRVNFVIVEDDRRLLGPGDLGWDLSAAREVWLDEGDPTVYFSKEDALAAQAREREGASR